MGIISALTERRSVSLENPKTSLSNPAAWLIDIFGGGKSAAGVDVNEKSALTSLPVLACVRVLSESVASLPLPVYKRLTPRGKERAPDHRLYELLHDRPNPEMSSFLLRETMQAHLCLWGNAYAEIERNNAGQPIALWPIPPERVKVMREKGAKLYSVRVDGRDVRFEQGEMLHICGLGHDGLVGYSPISMARHAIGLALATQEYGSRFFSNGSKPGGVIMHPNKLSKEAQERLKQSWEETQGGLTNAQRVAILEEGMEWKQMSIPPEDAQFLETRKFQVSEIARWFRVPPHMIGDLERATFSNVEQQATDFVVHSLRPWLVRWEQTLNYDLFSERERKQYFAEFVVDGLLRGDVQSRFNAYKVGRDGGWLSANDIREMENQNPLPGKQGDVYLVPLNVVPADQAGKAPVNPAEPSKDASTARMQRAYAGVLSDAARRVVRREASAATRAAKKGKEQFIAWVDEFYGDSNIDHAERVLQPVIESFDGSSAKEIARSIALRMNDESARELRAAAESENLEASVASIVERWERERVNAIAERESRTTFTSSDSSAPNITVNVQVPEQKNGARQIRRITRDESGRISGLETVED